MTKEELIEQAWHQGTLKWLLLPHQFKLYDAITQSTGLKYYANCARRFGKSTDLCVISLEHCLRTPNRQVRFAAPTNKMLRKITHPIYRQLLETCPDDIRPVYSSRDDIYSFHNGSEIHLAGTDAGHAENLRGTTSTLNLLDEAGFMDDLMYLLDDILLPQTLTTGGRTILSSTPPRTPEHELSIVRDECQAKGNYIEFDIYQNTSLSRQVIEQYCEEAGGPESTTWKREYLCQFIPDENVVLVPEWGPQQTRQYVVEPPIDEYYQYYHRYVSMDLGIKNDFTAALFGYYDFKRAALVIEDEFQIKGPEVTTDILRSKVVNTEMKLWGEKKPLRRISDNNNPLLIQDLLTLHNVPFIATDKNALHSMLNEVRLWVKQGRILISPKCDILRRCLENGIWENEKKIQFGRTKSLGHMDMLAALIYLVRNIDTNTNPIPFTHGISADDYFITKPDNSSKEVKAMKQMFFGGKNGKKKHLSSSGV